MNEGTIDYDSFSWGWDMAMQYGRKDATLNPASSATEGVEPVAWIEREVLEALAKEKTATGTVSSGLLKKPFGDKVGVYASPPNAEPAPVVRVTDAEIDELIEQLLDAQQDINLAANERMDQSLCNASALIDKTEALLLRLRSAALSLPVEGAAKEGVRS